MIKDCLTLVSRKCVDQVIKLYLVKYNILFQISKDKKSTERYEEKGKSQKNENYTKCKFNSHNIKLACIRNKVRISFKMKFGQ